MVLSRASFACVLVLLFVGAVDPTVHAQTAADAFFFAERPPAASTQLMGVAGASTAGVADIGAFYSNPAGLSLANTSMFSGSFRGLLSTNRSTYETFSGSLSDPNSFGRNPQDATATNYGLGNFGFLYKFPTEQGSFVMGGTVNETRLFGRDLDFANRNQLSSITDFFLPIGGEANIERFESGEAPELFRGQRLVETENNDFVVDFDPDGDGVINRPLSLAAFETLAIDLDPGAFDSAVPLNALVPVVEGGTQFRQVGDVQESGAIREINLGGSVEAAEDVHVGVGLNIHTGTYELRDVFEEIDDLNENDGSGNTVAFNRLRLTRRFETELAGFSMRFGLSTQISSRLRAGVTIETPTWYSLTERSSFQLQTVFDDGFSDTYGDQAGENAGRTEFEYRLRTPWRFGMGLTATISSLQVSGDVMFVDWTQMELQDGNFDLENDIISDEFVPVVQTRLGLEYDLSPLQLRAGVAYHPAPISLSDLSSSPLGGSSFFGSGVTDDRSRTYLSAGLGYDMTETLRLDMAWMQERFEDRSVPYNFENASFVNEEVRRNQVRIGMTFRF